jgi:hypothetical protein
MLHNTTTKNCHSEKAKAPFGTSSVATPPHPSILVDAEDAHFVHAWIFCHQEDQQHDEIETHRLLPEVRTVGSQQEGDHRYGCEKFPVGGVLNPVVQLFPEGLVVILPLCDKHALFLYISQAILGFGS